MAAVRWCALMLGVLVSVSAGCTSYTIIERRDEHGHALLLEETTFLWTWSRQYLRCWEDRRRFRCEEYPVVVVPEIPGQPPLWGAPEDKVEPPPPPPPTPPKRTPGVTIEQDDPEEPVPQKW